MEKIKFYATTWCPDCHRSKQILDEMKIEYDYINIEEVEGAADEVMRINNGFQSVPTIVFPDGTILTEPTESVLMEKISQIKE